MARLKDRYEEEIRPRADRAVRLLVADAGAASWRRSRSTWASARPSRTRRCSRPRRAARHDRRPEAEHPPRAQVGRRVQAARGHAGRRSGDAARRARVRVPRPADVGRDPADPRLPRPQPALVRRPRQLLHGRARADHLPRDRLRRRRPGARARRDDHDDRGDRRRGLRPARGARACRSPATGARPAPSPAGQPSRRTERGTPWPRPHRSCRQQRPAKYKTRAYTRCRRCGRPRAVYRKFGLCRDLPARARRTTASSPA